MKYKLFQVFDTKAESVAGPILIFPREGPAIRAFYDQLGDERTPYSKHPEDYTLTEIGTLDEESGLVMPRHYKDEENGGALKILAPEVIATGAEWKKNEMKARRYDTHGPPDFSRRAHAENPNNDPHYGET